LTQGPEQLDEAARQRKPQFHSFVGGDEHQQPILLGLVVDLQCCNFMVR